MDQTDEILAWTVRGYRSGFSKSVVQIKSWPASTHNSATHSLVVPSVSNQYVITDPTLYASIRNYSTQYPTEMSSTTVPNTYTVTSTTRYKEYMYSTLIMDTK